MPVFKKQLIQDMLNSNSKSVEMIEMDKDVISVGKMITANDIRARIKSPSFVEASIILLSKPSGFCVGCLPSVFSLLGVTDDT